MISKNGKINKFGSYCICKLIYKLISWLDRFEPCDEKLIHSFDCEGIEVLSDTGYVPVSAVHMTKPYEVYEVTTKNGMVLHCADEHIVFDADMDQVYVKNIVPGDYIQTIEGPSRVKSIKRIGNPLCMCDLTVDDEDHRYYTNGVLSHNTTTSAIFMLHYICFNFDKNSLVLGQKRSTAIEILDKTKKIFIELPYFLRPGIYKWNESSVVLDNGCRIMAEATTINSGISYTFHCVLADEFAHIPRNIIDKFYNNLFPTITAGRARFMIASTQNGYNLFYRLYMAAVNGENDYKPFKVDWYQVPEWNPDTLRWEKRDEEWHRRQVANYGSEEAFNMQFGTNFDVTANTLISQKTLTEKRTDLVEFVNKDLPGMPHSEYFFWDPSYDIHDLMRDYIMITCDISDGVGRDYTVFMMTRMVDKDTNNTECIGYFRSNALDRNESTICLLMLCSKYLNQNRYLVSIEWNTYGEPFLKTLWDNMDRMPEIADKFDPGNIVKYYNDSGTKYTNGIKITSGNKSPHCLLFKDCYERGFATNRSAQFMTELDKFTDDGTGHYRASYGHDDMVMAQVQLEFVKETLQYKLMRGTFDSGDDLIGETEITMFDAVNAMSNTYINREEEYKNNSRDLLKRLGGN